MRMMKIIGPWFVFHIASATVLEELPPDAPPWLRTTVLVVAAIGALPFLLALLIGAFAAPLLAAFMAATPIIALMASVLFLLPRPWRRGVVAVVKKRSWLESYLGVSIMIGSMMLFMAILGVVIFLVSALASNGFTSEWWKLNNLTLVGFLMGQLAGLVVLAAAGYAGYKWVAKAPWPNS